MAVRAANDASRLGLADSVVQCVCALKPARIRDGGNFHKSMLAKRAPAIAQGLWQDVYLIDWEDELLYVKLHVGRNGL
ncbi:MAG TPA: type II toxin-antitoxin system MqsR family toxin, partial [Gemmatimonadaceae bacterium]|nr:type II toxin-antitoxin system MqsR family toxin [Gemmatimonadaceae bacterium]